MNNKKLITAVSVLIFSAAVISFASLPDKVNFDDSISVQDTQLRLIGYGIKRILTIKIVAAAFYVQEGVDPQQILTDVPKRLEVIYLQNIPKSQLDRATIKGIRRNVSQEDYERLEHKIKELNEYWPSVRKYDRIALTYLPERGMVVNVNGKDKGAVQGKDIAAALFSVWVGENPADRGIKEKLLGQYKGEGDDGGL